jgi:hypothetical protein
LHRAHAIGSRKRGAIAHEAIEMRCLNVTIAERRDGVCTLIVAEKEENVGRAFGFPCLSTPRRGQAWRMRSTRTKRRAAKCVSRFVLLLKLGSCGEFSYKQAHLASALNAQRRDAEKQSAARSRHELAPLSIPSIRRVPCSLVISALSSANRKT